MICRGCGYELSGLSAGSCPECGRPFDPTDPATILTSADQARSERRWRWIGWAGLAGTSWPLVLFAWLHLMLVVARLSLGRWPHRMGRDDPKSIPIVSEMHWVGILAMVVMPLLVVGGIGALISLTVHDWRAGLKRLAVAVAVWVALTAIGDPAQVGVWFMD